MPSVDVGTFTAIASLALTAMSTTVAIVAGVFAFRQNVGWRPVIWGSDARMSGIPGLSERHSLHLSAELWNRRKYPIALRYAQAKVSGVTIRDQQPKPRSGEGHTQSNIIYRPMEMTVSPGDRGVIEFEAVIDDQSLDALAPLFCVEVWYFDPYRKKLESLILDYKFFYPFLGWEKSEDEKERSRAAYREVRASYLANAETDGNGQV